VLNLSALRHESKKQSCSEVSDDSAAKHVNQAGMIAGEDLTIDTPIAGVPKLAIVYV
jgi:hypothetical protein